MSERASIERTLKGLFQSGDLDDGRADRWDSLRESGLVHPFHAGALTWSEGALILELASRYAPGVPIAENIVASYFLAAYDKPLDMRRVTWADPSLSALELDAETVRGAAKLVPHAAVSSHILCEADSAAGRTLLCVEMRAVEALPGQNAAGEPRDDLRLSHATAVVLAPISQPLGPLFFMAALARSVQMVSLSEVVLELSLEHARTREQFGQPIARFQAVQHQLASLGCQIAAAGTAVALANRAIDREKSPTVSAESARLVASAKLRANELARTAISVGHAVHAAMGFTREHRLHRYTRRLMSYRAELGHERLHSRLIGEHLRTRGADALWDDLISSGS